MLTSSNITTMSMNKVYLVLVTSFDLRDMVWIRVLDFGDIFWSGGFGMDVWIDLWAHLLVWWKIKCLMSIWFGQLLYQGWVYEDDIVLYFWSIYWHDSCASGICLNWSKTICRTTFLKILKLNLDGSHVASNCVCQIAN